MACRVLVGASFEHLLDKLSFYSMSSCVTTPPKGLVPARPAFLTAAASLQHSSSHCHHQLSTPDTSRPGAALPRHVESGLPDGRQRSGGPHVSNSVAGQEAGQKEEAIRPAHQHFVIGLGWLGIEGGKRQQRGCRLEQASPYRYFP